jgi:GMP synthase (glutamine-hydrolysing)
MRSFRPIAVLVAGEPIDRVRSTHGGYADIIRRAAGEGTGDWIDVDLRDGATLPAPATLGAVIVTGSSASVTERAPWMLRAEDYLRVLVRERVPTFGICFGHQMLGQALGGEVVKNPRGREIGTVQFEIVGQDSLVSLATEPLLANATHVDTIGRLPLGARVIAKTKLEPHAVVRFSEAAWGVQFHPEMTRSIVRDYVEVRRELLSREGLDPEALAEGATEGAAGASTLVRFIAIAREAESVGRSA